MHKAERAAAQRAMPEPQAIVSIVSNGKGLIVKARGWGQYMATCSEQTFVSTDSNWDTWLPNIQLHYDERVTFYYEN